MHNMSGFSKRNKHKAMLRALCLSLALTFLLPFASFADGGSGAAGGTYTDNTGGTWSSARTGIRAYIVDENFKLVSNIVDIIPKLGSGENLTRRLGGSYATTVYYGKRGDLSTATIGRNQTISYPYKIGGNTTIWTIEAMDRDMPGVSKYFKNGVPVMKYNGSKFEATTPEWVDSLFGNPSSGLAGMVDGAGGTGAEASDYQYDASSTVKFMISNSIKNIRLSANQLLAGGASPDATLAELDPAINAALDTIEKSSTLSSVEKLAFGAEIQDIIARTLVGQPSPTLKSAPTMLFTRSYAAATTSGTLRPIYNDAGVLSILSSKLFKLTIPESEKVWLIQNASGTNSELISNYSDVLVYQNKLDELKASGQNIGHASVYASTTETCRKHGFVVVFEDLFYTPMDTTSGVTSNNMIYSTIGNYGIELTKSGFGFPPISGSRASRLGYTGGRNGATLHSVMVTALYTENDITFPGFGAIKSFKDLTDKGNSWLSSNGFIKTVSGSTRWLADAMEEAAPHDGNPGYGYGMIYFKFNPSNKLPEAQTYDTFTYNPNDGPHEAPNPNSSIPNSPYPTTSGEKPTYDEQKNDTRTVSIIKTYSLINKNQLDPETDLAPYELVTQTVSTRIRKNNPQKIKVQHEESYKVVDTFASIYDISDQLTPQTPFKEIVKTIKAQPAFTASIKLSGATTTTDVSVPSIVGNRITKKYSEVSSVRGSEIFHIFELGKWIKLPSSVSTPADQSLVHHYLAKAVYVHLVKPDTDDPLTHTWPSNPNPSDPTNPEGRPSNPSIPPDPRTPDTNPRYPVLIPPVIPTPAPPTPPTPITHPLPACSPFGYMIVKSYEIRVVNQAGTPTGVVEHVSTTFNPTTVGVIDIEDEQPYWTLDNWFVSNNVYPDLDSTDPWSDIVNTSHDGPSGVGPRTEQDIRDNPERTRVLYMQLYKTRREYVGDLLPEDISESQITRISSTYSPQFGWEFSSTGSNKMASYEHTFTLHVSCPGHEVPDGEDEEGNPKTKIEYCDKVTELGTNFDDTIKTEECVEHDITYYHSNRIVDGEAFNLPRSHKYSKHDADGAMDVDFTNIDFGGVPPKPKIETLPYWELNNRWSSLAKYNISQDSPFFGKMTALSFRKLGVQEGYMKSGGSINLSYKDIETSSARDELMFLDDTLAYVLNDEEREFILGGDTVRKFDLSKNGDVEYWTTISRMHTEDDRLTVAGYKYDANGIDLAGSGTDSGLLLFDLIKLLNASPINDSTIVRKNVPTSTRMGTPGQEQGKESENFSYTFGHNDGPVGSEGPGGDIYIKTACPCDQVTDALGLKHHHNPAKHGDYIERSGSDTVDLGTPVDPALHSNVHLFIVESGGNAARYPVTCNLGRAHFWYHHFTGDVQTHYMARHTGLSGNIGRSVGDLNPIKAILKIPTIGDRETTEVKNVSKPLGDLHFFPYTIMSYQITNDIEDDSGRRKSKYAEVQCSYGHSHHNQQIDLDNYDFLHFSKYQNLSRTAYILTGDDASSDITANAFAQIAWWNPEHFADTLSSRHYSLGMTSQQWATHKSAITNNEWRVPNQVLPGGAIYFLDTQNKKESYVQALSYYPIVDESQVYTGTAASGRQYIRIDNPGSSDMKYTTASEKSKNYFDTFEKVLEDYRLALWVDKDFNFAIDDVKNAATLDILKSRESTSAVKVLKGGESLSKLKGIASNYAANDAKYLLHNGNGIMTKNDAGHSGDIDIIARDYKVALYKIFTDTYGKVYIAEGFKTFSGSLETLKTTITNLPKHFMLNEYSAKGMKYLDGTILTKNNIKMNMSDAKSVGTVGDGYTYIIHCIGDLKDGETTAKILDRLKNTASLNHLFELDENTAFIRNTLASIYRNKGNDPRATWMISKGGYIEPLDIEDRNATYRKWYNEAFDGFYMLEVRGLYKVGLNNSPIRTSVLDPNLTPVRSSKGATYTNAHVAHFRVDESSTNSLATGKEPMYASTFIDMDITVKNLDQLFYSRKFYIPNATVQDLVN